MTKQSIQQNNIQQSVNTNNNHVNNNDTISSSTSSTTDSIRIAVVGCTHGELDVIYNTIQYIEQRNNYKIDLIICNGDFQCCRNISDLDSMSVPNKYKQIHNFYEYYNNNKHAAHKTIFIGGNHEASNYLTELYLGGYVCNNIYYSGYSNIINFAGYNIACISGIYNQNHYNTGHYETMPYNDNTKRSIYHVRKYEIDKILLYDNYIKHSSNSYNSNIDICMSHDWPVDITQYGNLQQLLRYKPFFKQDIYNNELGSPAASQLLHTVQPDYWFSAHLHCKFTAIVNHNNNSNKQTKFLALDKCIKNRDWLQIIELPNKGCKHDLYYNNEWLAILKSTLPYMSTNKQQNALNIDYNTIQNNINCVNNKLQQLYPHITNNLYPIHQTFTQTVDAYSPDNSNTQQRQQLYYIQNPQSKQLLDLIDCNDPFINHNSRYKQNVNDSNTVNNTTTNNYTQYDHTKTIQHNEEEIDI